MNKSGELFYCDEPEEINAFHGEQRCRGHRRHPTLTHYEGMAEEARDRQDAIRFLLIALGTSCNLGLSSNPDLDWWDQACQALRVIGATTDEMLQAVRDS